MNENELFMCGFQSSCTEGVFGVNARQQASGSQMQQDFPNQRRLMKGPNGNVFLEKNTHSR